MTAGRLVLCPTPLGNLEDITERTLRALRECDLVVAEDTRVTGALLRHFSIRKPLRSLHERTEAQRLREIRALLDKGKTVAFASDAGMPGISDPGAALVRCAREAGAAIDALPGPTAFVGALVLSGFDVSRFRFEGFPPRAPSQRRAYVRAFADESAAVVWYEAPTRIIGLLDDLERELPGRRVFVLREYTKKFEQHALGTAPVVKREIEQPPRGEFTVVLEGASRSSSASHEIPQAARDAVAQLVERGTHVRDAAESIARATGLSKNALYKAALSRRSR
ncbi:MAG: 16S rRNA (cytidine(1402)-2'-O)-methyltransferase [Candidatus Eremiobacteraeota bacterium]|nr:16S rRNA (cytidine(1402)-2'-O)-methyltransferase [Candidatus Eremiobacteraeota bacterium]